MSIYLISRRQLLVSFVKNCVNILIFQPYPVVKEVVKHVPVEKIVVKEVVKHVPVPVQQDHHHDEHHHAPQVCIFARKKHITIHNRNPY